MTAGVREMTGVTRLRGALEELRVDGGVSEFARVAGDFLAAHGARYRFAARPEPLSADETAALNAVGVPTGRNDQGLTPVIESASHHAALVTTAIPLADAARLLGVTEGRLRQRVAEGSLIALRGPDGRSLRAPIFQFMADGELPGLRRVLRAMRRDLKPVQAAAFFATPQPDLEDGRGEAVAPSAWLAAGGDPEAVAEIARGL